MKRKYNFSRAHVCPSTAKMFKNYSAEHFGSALSPYIKSSACLTRHSDEALDDLNDTDCVLRQLLSIWLKPRYDGTLHAFIPRDLHSKVAHCLTGESRRKFRSQTSDNMDRWKAEQGRGREKRKIRREKSRKRKRQKKEAADARKGRKVALHFVLPMIWGSGGSKSG